MDETRVYFGEALKALDDGGKVGGYLVRFTDKTRVDLDGEWFTAKTYYGAHEGDGVDTLFHHGRPLPVKSTSLTPKIKAELAKLQDHFFAPVKVTRDTIGLFAETVLNMADAYEAIVYDLAAKGKLGWSSGAVDHLAKVAASGEILRWPIGEASLTPIPADPHNKAISIKALSFIKFLDFENESETKTIKGMLAQEMADDVPSWWDIYSSFCDLVCDIAEAANANQDILAAPINVEQKVRDLFAELTTMGAPIVVQQITDYVGKDDPYNEFSFYLKSLEAGLPFDQAEPVMAKFIKAMERNHSNRVKEGRMLSAANRKKLQTLHDGIMTHAQAAKDLLDASEPKPKFADPRKVRALRLQLLQGAT